MAGPGISKDRTRVIIRGTNWVGDAMMTVPALREIRRLLPNAHITLATRPWAQDLFAEAAFLDDILIDDRRGFWSVFGQAADWRRGKFDLALIFPNSFAAALVPALARVPIRIGYATEGRGALLTNPLPLPEWRSSRHEVFYYLNIVAELERFMDGATVITDPLPDGSISVSQPRRAKAVDLLRTEGVREGHLIVALCPGSINSRAKRWPAERFADLGDSLIEQLDVEVLLIGSKEELDVSLEVSGRMRNQPIVLTGKTDLGQAASVISLIDLLITNDTGPAHIAAALGRPTLVIFGPTNPLTTRPFSPVAEMVRHPPDCAPCMLRDCPIDHRCMTAISPEEVLQRARRLLEQNAQFDKLQFVAPGGREFPKRTAS